MKKFEILDCAEMSDEELVRILTLDKEDYTAATLQRANRETWQRRLEVTQFINRVEVSLNGGEPENCTIDVALAKLKQEISLWEVWRFANCLREAIGIQKEVAFWTVDFFIGEKYQQSFQIKNLSEVEALAAQFLRLAGGSYRVDFEYDLRACEAFVESSSLNYIEKISRILTAADIPHTVSSSERFDFNVISGARQAAGVLSVLVPPEYKDAVRKVAAQVENKIQALRDAIAALAANNERDPRLLERYEQLAQLVEDDPVVSYGRGVLLFARGRNEEAAEAFIETLRSRGNLSDEEYEAYQKESEEYLVRLAEALPKNSSILHTLADTAMSEQDNASAIAYYEKILAAFPADSIAHMNLGFLYYQDPNANARAARHFKTYLELEPQAEDRAGIEEILAGL